MEQVPENRLRDIEIIATDIDGNGTPDLAIGDPYHHGGGTFRGAVEILFLFPGGNLKKSQLISDQVGGFLGMR